MNQEIENKPNELISNFQILRLSEYQAEDLIREEVFQDYYRVILEINDLNEGVDAKQVFVILFEFLTENRSLPQKAPDLYRRYINLLVVLRANFFGLVDDSEVKRFLNQFLLQSVYISQFEMPRFKLKEKLWRFVKFSMWYLDNTQALQMAGYLRQGIEQNTELLGDSAIKLSANNEIVEQTIANWIKSYNQFVYTSKSIGGATQRLSFLNTVKSVSTLDHDQKNMLLGVLEIYDWLKKGKFDQNVLDSEEYMEDTTELIQKISEKKFKSVVDVTENRDESKDKGTNFKNQIEYTQSPKTPLPKSSLDIKKLIPKAPSPIIQSRILRNPPAPPQQIRQKPKMSPAPAPKPPTQTKSEDYGKEVESTLDELQKMREEYEGEGERADVERQRGAYRTTRDTVYGSAAPPKNIRRDSISVNEAIIREGRNGRGNSGEIVTGGKEIDEKLEELKKKIEGN